MFHRFALAVFMSALVPIFGLSSCSKDRTDDWSMSEPTVTAGSVSYPITAADHKNLPRDARLRFNGSPWSTLEIKSTCFADASTYEDAFKISYQETIELKSLWPRSLTSKVSDTELVASSCDFKFVATSENQSTQKFSLSGIQLTSFVEPSEQLFLRHAVASAKALVANPTPVELPITVRQQASYLESVIEGLTHFLASESALVALNCEGNSVEVESNRREKASLNELIKKSALSGTHHCHFVARVPNAATNEFEISADAPIRFTSLNLSVAVTPWDPQPYRSSAFQRIEISNSNPEAAEIVVPSIVPNARTRSAYVVDRSLVMDSLESLRTFKVQVSGANSVGDDHFVIPANGTAVVEVLTADIQATCYSPGQSTAPAAGLRWGYVSGYAIQQVETGETSGSPIYNAPVIVNPYSYPASEMFEPYRQDYGPTVPDSIQPGSDSQLQRITRC